MDEGLAEALIWDRGNREHATRHGVSRGEIDGMYAAGEWIRRHDPRGRPGQYRLTGPTPAGRLVTVAAEWLPDRRAYRPISAWGASPREQARWRREALGEE